MRTSPHARMADITALVVRKSRTINELADILDTNRKSIEVCMKALEAKALVKRTNIKNPPQVRTKQPYLWEWTA